MPGCPKLEENKKLFEAQKNFYTRGQTLSFDHRIQTLTRLKAVIVESKTEVFSALLADFHKSSFETEMTELNLVLNEIDDSIKNLKKWMKPIKVGSNLLNWPSQNYRIPEPYGVTLVMGAWNYPFNLSLVPAVAALAAGNTVVIKPSELAPRTAEVIFQMISKNFPAELIGVVLGGVEVTTELLKHKWDKIFFTGSTKVGKIVYQAAAQNLTPVTLELGGKSPAILDASCNLQVSTQRIVWGKFINAGQTCIAPDYIYVHRSRHQELIEQLKVEIQKAHYSLQNENYVQIINTQNFDRVVQLIDPKKVVIGGKFDRNLRWIEPTVMDKVSWNDPVMQEEIFGPVLPILIFDSMDEVLQTLNQQPAPLSLYYFSESGDRMDWMKRFSFGGGAVNECVMHFANPHLPFGGRGHSGLGHYHGKSSFECFSHYKSVMIKPTFFEPPLKYYPRKNWKKKLINWVSKLG